MIAPELGPRQSNHAAHNFLQADERECQAASQTKKTNFILLIQPV